MCLRSEEVKVFPLAQILDHMSLTGCFGSNRNHAPRPLNNNFLKVFPISKHMHTPTHSTFFASCFAFCFSWHVLVLDKYSFHGGACLSGPRESTENGKLMNSGLCLAKGVFSSMWHIWQQVITKQNITME